MPLPLGIDVRSSLVPPFSLPLLTTREKAPTAQTTEETTPPRMVEVEGEETHEEGQQGQEEEEEEEEWASDSFLTTTRASWDGLLRTPDVLRNAGVRWSGTPPSEFERAWAEAVGVETVATTTRPSPSRSGGPLGPNRNKDHHEDERSRSVDAGTPSTASDTRPIGTELGWDDIIGASPVASSVRSSFGSTNKENMTPWTTRRTPVRLSGQPSRTPLGLDESTFSRRFSLPVGDEQSGEREGVTDTPSAPGLRERSSVLRGGRSAGSSVGSARELRRALLEGVMAKYPLTPRAAMIQEGLEHTRYWGSDQALLALVNDVPHMGPDEKLLDELTGGARGHDGSPSASQSPPVGSGGDVSLPIPSRRRRLVLDKPAEKGSPEPYPSHEAIDRVLEQLDCAIRGATIGGSADDGTGTRKGEGEGNKKEAEERVVEEEVKHEDNVDDDKKEEENEPEALPFDLCLRPDGFGSDPEFQNGSQVDVEFVGEDAAEEMLDAHEEAFEEEHRVSLPEMDEPQEVEEQEEGGGAGGAGGAGAGAGGERGFEFSTPSKTPATRFLHRQFGEFGSPQVSSPAISCPPTPGTFFAERSAALGCLSEGEDVARPSFGTSITSPPLSVTSPSGSGNPVYPDTLHPLPTIRESVESSPSDAGGKEQSPSPFPPAMEDKQTSPLRTMERLSRESCLPDTTDEPPSSVTPPRISSLRNIHLVADAQTSPMPHASPLCDTWEVLPTNGLDFGFVLADTVPSLPLHFHNNNASGHLSLSLFVRADRPHMERSFALSWDEETTRSSNRIRLGVKPGETKVVRVCFGAQGYQHEHGLVTYEAEIHAVAKQGDVLKKVPVVAVVGFGRLQVHRQHQTLSLSCLPSRSVFASFPLRNAGCLSLPVHLGFPPCETDIFVVEPTSFVLEPKGVREVFVSYCPPAAGHHTAPLSLQTPSTTFRIAVEGHTVEPPTLLCNQPLVHFGSLSLGSSHTRELVVRNAGSTETKIHLSIVDDPIMDAPSETVRSQARPFTIESAHVLCLEPQCDTRVHLRFAPERVATSHCLLLIEAEGGFVFKIPLFGIGGTSRLVLQSSSEQFMAFGEVKESSSLAQTITLTNLGHRSGFVRILFPRSQLLDENVVGTGGRFKVSPSAVVVRPGGVQDFRVTYTPCTHDARHEKWRHVEVDVQLFSGDEINRKRRREAKRRRCAAAGVTFHPDAFDGMFLGEDIHCDSDEPVSGGREGPLSLHTETSRTTAKQYVDSFEEEAFEKSLVAIPIHLSGKAIGTTPPKPNRSPPALISSPQRCGSLVHERVEWRVTPTNLTLQTSPGSRRPIEAEIRISNPGPSGLPFHVVQYTPLLEVVPRSGTLPPRDTIRISISIRRRSLNLASRVKDVVVIACGDRRESVQVIIEPTAPGSSIRVPYEPTPAPVPNGATTWIVTPVIEFPTGPVGSVASALGLVHNPSRHECAITVQASAAATWTRDEGPQVLSGTCDIPLFTPFVESILVPPGTSREISFFFYAQDPGTFEQSFTVKTVSDGAHLGDFRLFAISEHENAAIPREPTGGGGGRSRKGLYVRKSTLHLPPTLLRSERIEHVVLCNGSKETITAMLPQIDEPFLVRHRRFPLRPRSYVQLPVRFYGEREGTFRRAMAIVSLDGRWRCTVHFIAECVTTPLRLSPKTLSLISSEGRGALLHLVNVGKKKLAWSAHCSDKRIQFQHEGVIGPDSVCDVPVTFVGAMDADFSRELILSGESFRHIVRVHCVRG